MLSHNDTGMHWAECKYPEKNRIVECLNFEQLDVFNLPFNFIIQVSIISHSNLSVNYEEIIFQLLFTNTTIINKDIQYIRIAERQKNPSLGSLYSINWNASDNNAFQKQ